MNLGDLPARGAGHTGLGAGTGQGGSYRRTRKGLPGVEAEGLAEWMTIDAESGIEHSG